MPSTTTMHVCDLCKTEYPTAREAEKCESNGFPPTPEYETGDEIKFERERRAGPRWVYESGSGTIQSAALFGPKDPYESGHVWVFYVIDERKVHSLVLRSEEGEWFRPAEYAGVQYDGPDMLQQQPAHA